MFDVQLSVNHCFFSFFFFLEKKRIIRLELSRIYEQ